MVKYEFTASQLNTITASLRVTQSCAEEVLQSIQSQYNTQNTPNPAPPEPSEETK